MKVIVFGATGSVGKLAVANLLKKEIEVTAFSRSPERLNIAHENLDLFSGNAFSRTDVSNAIKGHDAVIVALGSGRSRKSTIRSKGTMNIIQGMQEHGIDRMICQTTLGAHESWTNLNFFWKRIMFGFWLKTVFLEHELQENLIQVSGLDWTIVRPSAFTDGPATGAFNIDFSPSFRNLKLQISRLDVANFLSTQLSDLSYIQRAVSISN